MQLSVIFINLFMGSDFYRQYLRTAINFKLYMGICAFCCMHTYVHNFKFPNVISSIFFYWSHYTIQVNGNQFGVLLS